MEKYIRMILITLLSVTGIVSCKKDTGSDVKEAATSIKDKTWWGVFTYSGKKPEYYSVHFNADKSLLWSQMSGDYPGTWVINDKQLIMTFPGSEIKADISTTGKLTNITDDNAASEVNTGELVANADIPLDNTVWKGIQHGSFGSVYKLTVGFGSPLRFDITVETMPKEEYTYKRSPSGGSFLVVMKGGRKFFGVIQSPTQMKGTQLDSDFPWEATRQ